MNTGYLKRKSGVDAGMPVTFWPMRIDTLKALTSPVMCPLCFQDARVDNATSTAARRLDCSDIGIGDRFRQGDRRNLPENSPFVLAPAALTLFAAVADDRVPVTISFGLVSGCDLKRECQVVLDLGSAIKPEAGNAHHGKLDRQHIPFLPGRKVSRGAVRCADV